MHPHLDAGDVAVEDRRGHRAERRSGMEAALQDEDAVVEADKNVTELAAQAEPDVLLGPRVELELAAQATAQDVDAAHHGPLQKAPAHDRYDGVAVSRGSVPHLARAARCARGSGRRAPSRVGWTAAPAAPRASRAAR